MAGEAAVALVASRYDDEEGLLTEGALRRLAERQASAGKVCATCGVQHSLSEFGPEARRADGLKASCRMSLARGRRESREAAYASTNPDLPI